MSYGPLNNPIEIWLQYPVATCCICGDETPSCWGIPISDETAEIVANDFEGEWGGAPACEDCWKRHETGEFVGEYKKF